MHRFLISTLLLLAGILPAAQAGEPFPADIFVEAGSHHVQGIAFDREAGCMYFSFTTQFIKTDLQGHVLGSIDHIQGHLGAMTFNPKDRKVYASLECKDDEVGRGLSGFAEGHSLFYVALIDVDKVTAVGMDSENNEAFKVACIREAVRDFTAKVETGGRLLDHRHGCSGIDGVTLAPKTGRTGGRDFLWVAYGIYGDTTRTDNDDQVLLRYDLRTIRRSARTVRFGEFDESGPERPEEKRFIRTGNTTYGVQNMAYDPFTGLLFLAVYPGKKPGFPNHPLFIVDRGGNVRGCGFKWGATGLCPLGDGLWYISKNGRNPETGRQFCHARLYRWTGDPADPFERIEETVLK